MHQGGSFKGASRSFIRRVAYLHLFLARVAQTGWR
ncbi:hypothetical protein A2U01_0103684, partial [Trifolium medium]|nr:hypothetical protein [Trifolium medium]